MIKIIKDFSRKYKSKYLRLKGGASGVESVVPKNIFMYWHDTKTIPMFVSKCIKQCQDMHPDYNIVIHDEMSIKEELKEDKEFLSLLLDHKLANEHKSDLIRLYLISKNGGIYCDASTIWGKKIHEIFDLNYNGVQGVSVPFKTDIKQIENGYIVAPKNNNLIKKWYEEFKYAISISFESYAEKFKNDFPNEKDLISWLPYLTAHACLNRIIKDKDKHYKLKVLPSYHYELHIENDWNRELIREKVKINNYEIIKKNNYKMTKIRGCERKIV